MKVSIKVCDLEPGHSVFVQQDSAIVRLTAERSEVVLEANDGALIALDNAPDAFSGAELTPAAESDPATSTENSGDTGLTADPEPV